MALSQQCGFSRAPSAALTEAHSLKLTDVS